jgi:hypothetical protein
MRILMENLTFGGEVRRVSDKPSDISLGQHQTRPEPARRPDGPTALSCSDATQRVVKANPQRRGGR